jgi:hypothetical protein
LAAALDRLRESRLRTAILALASRRCWQASHCPHHPCGISHRSLQRQAQTLKLHGLLAHWDEVRDQPWLQQLLGWDDEERRRR